MKPLKGEHLLQKQAIPQGHGELSHCWRCMWEAHPITTAEKWLWGWTLTSCMLCHTLDVGNINDAPDIITKHSTEIRFWQDQVVVLWFSLSSLEGGMGHCQAHGVLFWWEKNSWIIALCLWRRIQNIGLEQQELSSSQVIFDQRRLPVSCVVC